MVLNHWNITLQAQSYDILPGEIILAMGQQVFLGGVLNFPLHMYRAFDKGASTTNLKSLVWLSQESNMEEPPRHGANYALPLGYRVPWSYLSWNLTWLFLSLMSSIDQRPSCLIHTKITPWESQVANFW